MDFRPLLIKIEPVAPVGSVEDDLGLLWWLEGYSKGRSASKGLSRSPGHQTGSVTSFANVIMTNEIPQTLPRSRQQE